MPLSSALVHPRVHCVHSTAQLYATLFHFISFMCKESHGTVLVCWSLELFSPFNQVWVKFHSLDSIIPCPLPVSCDSTFPLAYVAASLSLSLSLCPGPFFLAHSQSPLCIYLFSTNQHFAVIISNLALLERVALKLIANPI